MRCAAGRQVQGEHLERGGGEGRRGARAKARRRGGEVEVLVEVLGRRGEVEVVDLLVGSHHVVIIESSSSSHHRIVIES